MQTGLVFNIQKYSVQDGPGIRTTVFFKGCPLCCAWCHNPESMSAQKEMILLENRCVVCGECRSACPLVDSGPVDNPASLPARQADCLLCEACVQACPTEARQTVGKSMTTTEVWTEIWKDRIFYEESGGGVTLSGGEPLLQPEFAKELLATSRKHGIHAAVDTCGFGGTDQLLSLVPLTNLFLYDLKFMDDTLHRRYCGVSNALILQNLMALDRSGANIWIRLPLIPGLNNTEENLTATAQFVGSLRHVRQIHLLPYHQTAKRKFQRLGRVYQLPDIQPPSTEEMASACDKFRAFGLSTHVDG
jgi:pyruvate formate lyase activating enzyme